MQRHAPTVSVLSIFMLRHTFQSMPVHLSQCRLLPLAADYGLLRVKYRREFCSSASSQSSANPPDIIAEAFLSKFSQGQKFVRKQLLDANQLRLFSLTLDRAHLWPSSSSISKFQTLEDLEPAEGTPLPPGYHLAYFTPPQLLGILGLDGTDASFNPNSPFTRRMWAGGSVHWPSTNPNSASSACLKVGDTATEITRVLSCEPKIIKKTGESMLVVGVEKEFRDSKDNLCILDKRNWVFREALDPSKPAPILVKPDLLSETQLANWSEGKVVRRFTRDVVQLFRFSALTFNGHRIHYDKPWATQVEGHRNVVVHGPMNLISMLDLWRDENVDQSLGGSRGDAVYPKEIEYRAKSPVYAGEGYRILMNDGGVDRHQVEMRILSDDGTTCMNGTIIEW